MSLVSSLCFSVYVYELDATDRVRKERLPLIFSMRTTRQTIRKIKKMRPATPPATPPAIALVLNRFEVTEAAPIVLSAVPGGTKLVCTSICVDVDVDFVDGSDVDWSRWNQ